MRRLLGYVCHRASVRLHEAAIWLLEWEDDQHAEPAIWFDGVHGDGITPSYPPIDLEYAAPAIDSIRDTIRGKWQHVAWLAMDLCAGRDRR